VVDVVVKLVQKNIALKLRKKFTKNYIPGQTTSNNKMG
jgi:hypothetical protein